MTAVRAYAIAIATLAGACAVLALAVGSPLQFGIALALCGAGWIAADFIEWAHAPRVCAIPVSPLGRGYSADHVVFAGGAGHSLPAATRAEIRLAA